MPGSKMNIKCKWVIKFHCSNGKQAQGKTNKQTKKKQQQKKQSKTKQHCEFFEPSLNLYQSRDCGCQPYQNPASGSIIFSKSVLNDSDIISCF